MRSTREIEPIYTNGKKQVGNIIPVKEAFGPRPYYRFATLGPQGLSYSLIPPNIIGPVLESFAAA